MKKVSGFRFQVSGDAADGPAPGLTTEHWLLNTFSGGFA
jgi:hypothetical protein